MCLLVKNPFFAAHVFSETPDSLVQPYQLLAGVVMVHAPLCTKGQRQLVA